MLRALIAIGSVTVAAGVGGLIWANAECPGGSVIRNSWQCVRNAGFEPQFCRGVFSAEEDAISRAPPAYATEVACRAAFSNCVESSRPAGWAPKPRAYCVTVSEGRITHIERL